MPRPISTLHKQCQSLWVKALSEPTTITFPTAKEAARAKFVFYDAARAAKRQGQGEPELIKAAMDVEIVTSPDKLSITLRARTVNPFYGGMEKVLAGVLGEADTAASSQSPTREPAPEEVSSSLDRMLKALDISPEPAAPAANPYYNREEL